MSMNVLRTKEYQCNCARDYITNGNGECALLPKPLDLDVELEVTLAGEFTGKDNNSLADAVSDCQFFKTILK